MTKNIFTLLLTLLSLTNFAQTIQWKKTIGGTADDFTRNITQTSDGGYITAASTLSNNGDITGHHGSFDYWIVKLDGASSVQWKKAIGGSGYDFAHSIKQTKEGGFIVIGWSDSNDGDVTGNHGDSDIWIVKLDATGNIQWQKSFGGSSADFGYSIHQNSDSTYIVCGKTFSIDGDITSNKGAHDFWLLKLDKTGNLMWQKTYGGSNNDYAHSVAQTFFDGGYIIAGTTNSSDGDVTNAHGLDDAWVLKLDGQGAIQWKKTIGGTKNDIATQVYQTGDQGFVLIGNSESNDGDLTNNYGLADCWVVKLDNSGNIQWQKNYGGPGLDIGNAIKQTSDNGYIIAAWSDSDSIDVTLNQGGADYWIMKLDPNGNITWQQSYGGSSTDFCYAIDITSDGGFIVAGNTASNDGDVSGNHNSLHDVWIVKFNGLPLSANNNLTINEPVIFPNPNNGIFTIKNLDPNSLIEIYDITGRILFSQKIENINNFKIDFTDKSTGIYIYKIAKNGVFTGKIIKN